MVSSPNPALVGWVQDVFISMTWQKDSFVYAYITHGYTIGVGHFNSSPRGQNDQHFADDVFKRIFLNENVRNLMKISMKFVPEGQINNNTALA